MMNQLSQTELFFNGSVGSKGVPRSQTAQGSQGADCARPGEGSFLAIFQETCQLQEERGNSAVQAKSHKIEEEETAEPRPDQKEGDFTGVVDPAWFFFLAGPDGEPAGEAGAGSVDSDQDGEHGSVYPVRTGPVTAEAGFAGESIPNLTEREAGTERPVAAMEAGPVQEENGGPVLVSSIAVPVAEEKSAAGAEPAGETVTESMEMPAFVRGANENGEPGGAKNPDGTENPGSGLTVSSQSAATEGAKTQPAAGRRGQENSPHPPAGEKPAPALEQLKVEKGGERTAFSGPGKGNAYPHAAADAKDADFLQSQREVNTRAAMDASIRSKREEPEVFAAPADPVRGEALPVAEEVNQGERSPVAENVVNQILQGARLMVKNGVAHMRLELQPPELGKLQLALVVEKDLVTARFTAESQTVQALIEANLPELRSALQEAGLQVDQLQVDVQTGTGSQSDSFGQLLPENFSSGADALEMDGRETVFSSETGSEEGMREEAIWPGRVNLRV